VACLAFGLGSLAIFPWLLRTYYLKGYVPGLSAGIDLITSVLPRASEPVAPAASSPAVDGASSTIVSSTTDIAASSGLVGRFSFDHFSFPWLWPFEAGPSAWQVFPEAELGISLLLLLPLALLAPRTRATALLALTVGVSYLGWWMTPQNPRHLLPTLAIAAVLAGIGVATAWAARPTGLPQVLARTATFSIVVGIVVVPLFFAPVALAQWPLGFIAGRESSTAFVNRVLPATPVLAAASDLLPADTRVGYIGLWEGAQIYTETRLWPLGTYSVDEQNWLDHQLGSTPEAVLASLQQSGLRYFIWDRPTIRPEDWDSTLLSTSFLREHTRILTADNAVYLFEVLPRGDTSWGERRPRNMLDDPTFDKLQKKRGAWTPVGPVTATPEGVEMWAESALVQRVPVVGGQSYLLTAAHTCPNEVVVSLRLHWFDGDGVELGVVAEPVHFDGDESEQFIWGRAPNGATTVAAELEGAPGCVLNMASLYDVS
jgi:hypothetical protein